jgi:hypothetical protein
MGKIESLTSAPLHESLPHNAPTFTQFGWWYHYLLDRTPGWWNRQGASHIYFRDVIAFALGVELSTMGSDTTLIGYAAGAFATKASAPGEGFYKFIGSRQSVFMRVNNALYGTSSGKDSSGNPLSYNFSKFQGNFNPSQDEADYHIQSRYGGFGNWGEDILYKRGFTQEQLLAWEWGNPTNASPQKFKNALKNPTQGTCVDCLLHFSGRLTDSMIPYPDPAGSGLLIYGIEVVLSLDQMNNLCGINSCVAP